MRIHPLNRVLVRGHLGAPWGERRSSRARPRSWTIVGAVIVLVMTLGLAGPARAQESEPTEIEFTVPEGFDVEFVHKADSIGSIINLSFDAEGRLVYSREDTSIYVLEEEDGSLQARELTDQITNSQGFIFDGPDLLAVGDGPDGVGLYRLPGLDGESEAPQLITRVSGETGEHGPHAVLYGPDGYLYWALGNHAGIEPTPAPLSPHRDYYEGDLLPSYTDPRGHADSIRAPGGIFIRKNLAAPESDWEMVAGGFRNQYDGAFTSTGELVTFDSDMEWDRNLPWFRPVRTVHVVPGGEYGWRTGSRKWPEYAPESLPPMSNAGRGSPTGVEVYLHHVYPEEYHGMVFYADWSRGRVLVGFAEKSGATFSEELTDFVEGTPLNVTDIAVGPDGYLYFSLGGRDTQGGIWRVVYDGENEAEMQDGTPVEQALAQPQPRSSWGREAIRRFLAQMPASERSDALRAVASDENADPMRRVRALEILHVHAGGIDEDLLMRLAEDDEWSVRAAAVYYLGLHATDRSRQELVRRLRDEDAVVRRRAAEALIRTGVTPSTRLDFDPVTDVMPLLGDSARFVRYAARELLERTNRNLWQEAAVGLGSFPAAVEALLALVHTMENSKDTPPILEREIELLRTNPSNGELRDLLRAIELTMVNDYGIFYSYLYQDIGELLLERFPSGDEALDTELARTLGYVQPEGTIDALRLALERGDHSREYQIHVAYALRNVSGDWSEERRESVIDWFARAMEEDWNGGASFRGYLQNIWTDFVALLPEEDQVPAKERVPELSPGFGPEPEAEELAFRREDYEESLSKQELYEELLYDPEMHEGDPQKGLEAFEKAFCGSCHTFGEFGEGGFGPDLSTVGQRFSRQDLIESIVYPSRTISDFWGAVEVTTEDGESYIGMVTQESATSVTMTLRTKQPITIDQSNIASRERAETSPMPDHLLYNLSEREMADLLELLEAGLDAVDAESSSEAGE